jgi:alginate O-acetyltransferase complex protein AlgI
MTLVQILVFIGMAVLVGSLHRERWRGWLLMVSSLLAIYWMQPSMPIRNLDFWLPTLTIILAVFVWICTQTLTWDNINNNLAAAVTVIALILLMGLTRYLGPVCCLIPSRPPEITWILLALTASGVLFVALWRWSSASRLPVYLLIFSILGLFLILKMPALAQQASVGLRTATGQQIELASALDIRWLGFSYVAFRLIHSLRDRLSGKLPDLSMQDFINYIILFPAFTAGPIDRVQHFSQELRRMQGLNSDRLFEGFRRITWGALKKFALADALAIFALGPSNAIQTTSVGWLWLLLYAYSFRLFFDFSGYTDIAIGLGILMGIKLPENFDQPYLKQNLTAFWNSWHMTLAQWFRAYFFNPVTRLLRTSRRHLPLPLILLTGQMGTMLLIGLWHGVSWNFAIWGAWHGIGLFFHNRWSEALRSRLGILDTHPVMQKGLGTASTLLTFHYVTLGWIWFALPTPQLSLHVLAMLFHV